MGWRKQKPYHEHLEGKIPAIEGDLRVKIHFGMKMGTHYSVYPHSAFNQLSIAQGH